MKNALSPYKLGGAAGGSDFDAKGKSESEVLTILSGFLSFCNKCLSLYCRMIFQVYAMMADNAFLSKLYKRAISIFGA